MRDKNETSWERNDKLYDFNWMHLYTSSAFINQPSEWDWRMIIQRFNRWFVYLLNITPNIRRKQLGFHNRCSRTTQSKCFQSDQCEYHLVILMLFDLDISIALKNHWEFNGAFTLIRRNALHVILKNLLWHTCRGG